jgi:GNAT superfamily N-acetyltransferase
MPDARSHYSEIRWATAKDADRLLPLLSALYAHDTPDAEAPDQDTITAHVALLLDTGNPHKLAIAWSKEGRAVGLASVALFTSLSDPRPDRWRQMELKELFVLPGNRGQGLGQSLFTWVEAHARQNGAHRMDWHVKADNVRGIEFYKRLGADIVPNRRSMRRTLLEG